jgi:hypothetical protein
MNCLNTFQLRALLGCAVAACVVAWVAQPARAAGQDDKPEVITEDAEKKLKEAIPDEVKEGWTYGLNLGANLSFNHNRKVVGTIDGLTMQVGAILKGSLGLIRGTHEWSSTLVLEHGQTKTPQLENFVKSTDNLDLRSLYTWRVTPWFGPFARMRFQTQVVSGYDVRADSVTIVRKDTDGSTVTETVAPQARIDLTKPFEPMLLTESAGALATAVNIPEARVDFKLGLGGQHIFSRGGFALTDDASTPEIEYTRLQSSNSMGGEFEVEGSGQIADNIGWKFLTTLFYPFVTSFETDLKGAEILHVEVNTALSVKLAGWLSFDYVLSAKYLPFIVNEWQVQNLALLTAGFDIF